MPAGAGLRIDLDEPRQVSVTHLRAADLAAATHDIDVVARRRDGRPSRCRAPRPRHRQLRAGHPARVPARRRHVPLGLDAARPPTELTDADRMVGGRPRVPPPQRPDQLRRRGQPERLARPSLFRPRARRRPDVRPRRDAGRSTASPTASATRSPLEYPTTGSGDYRVPALTVEQADGSSVLELVYVEHRIRAGKPGRPPEDGLPVDLRRGRRRGGDARDRRSPTSAAASPSSCRTRSSATGPSSPGAPGSATTGQPPSG